MDFEKIQQKILTVLKKYPVPAALSLPGLIFFVYGLISLFGQFLASPSITFETLEENKKSSESSVLVDVEGAVLYPGVYALPSDMRLNDALIKAGGLSENADKTWIEKNMNLALKLKDGMKIYIKRTGELENSISTEGKTGSITNAGLININSATIQELESLPGIGIVTAQRILDARPYGVIEDLLIKKIVSKSVFEKIKEKITAQ